MQPLHRVSVLAAAVVLAPALVSAQTTSRPSSAAGLDAGWFVPAIGSDDCCPGQNVDRSGPSIDSFYERYVRPRIGIRLGVGYWNAKRGNVEEHRVRYLRAGADVIFKGRGDAVNVYIGGDAGVYRLRGRLDTLSDRDETATKPGATLFLGGEFFAFHTVALTIEGRYHAIASARAFAPEGINLTVGFRTFF